MEGCTGDVLISLHDVSDPSPSLQHDGSANAVLAKSDKKIRIADGLRLEQAQCFLRFFVRMRSLFVILRLEYAQCFLRFFVRMRSLFVIL